MDILMPQLGETVSEGKITTWFKAVGEVVKPGDNLFEIETDKVSMEVPATSSGVLSEIRVGVGQVALVGAVVAIVGDKVGAAASSPPVPAAAPKAAASAPDPVTETQSTTGADAAFAPQLQRAPLSPLDPFHAVRTPLGNYGPARLANGTQITPLARRLAREAGVDPAQLRGSGPHGRVVARDVEQAAASAGSGRGASATTGAGASAAQVKALYADTPYEEIPLDGMRRTIATRLIEAKQTIPHFYLTSDIDLTRLNTTREEINAAAPRGPDGDAAYKISVNDFIIKALAMALQRVPAANAVWAHDRILRFGQSDIGVAVALEGGLITPVVRHADSKSLTAISIEMRDLATRARNRKLRPSEYQGGAAAISNLGMYGVREFSAIINPPHATILAVGAARRAPVEGPDGGVRFVSQMSVTLSCDHRVVDGALGATLLAAFKALMEQPVTMLV